MRNFFILILIFSLSFTACNDDSDKSNNTGNKTVKQDTADDADNSTYLTVEGKDIWVRNAPATGDVVMKLNNGDKCKVLQKGNEQTINGVKDFWYKIDFNNNTGWIFGSQTSLKAKQKKQAKPKSNALNEVNNFLSELQANPEQNSNYFFDNQGFLFINTNGVFLTINFTNNLKSIENIISAPSKHKLQMERWPEYDEVNYIWEKEGYFAQKINGSDVFSSTIEKIKDSEMQVDNTVIQKSKSLSNKITMRVLNTQTNVRYYLGQKQQKWKLIGIDISDFN